MTLGELQRAFTSKVATLITWAYSHSYELTFGEAWRTPEQAAWNAAHGIGISHSEHLIRLAVDLNLFIDGVYQTGSGPYKPLGDFWKSLSTTDVPCCWGGDFHTKDANHFSVRFQGVE